MDSERKREYRRKYDLNRYHIRRNKAILQLGGKCNVCGSVRNLEIDHINRDSKEFNISVSWGVSEKRFQKELQKCQLLCSQCHKTKSISESVTIKHGTWGMIRRKCKCTVCKTFSSAYFKKRKRLR